MKEETMSRLATLTIFSLNLSEAISERVENTASFTTVTDNEPSKILPIAIGLISLETYIKYDDIAITHIGIIRKNMRVATGQVRVNVTDIFELPRHLPIGELVDAMPKRWQNGTKEAFSVGYKKVSPKAGEHILKKLLELYPENSKDFEKVLLKFAGKALTQSPRIQDAATEKDALGIALDIFGADRSKILRSWNGENVGKSFLSGIEEYSANEDEIIFRDLRRFPGMDILEDQDIAGVVEFENKHGEKLTVINANRKTAERATGVDLIYFNRQYMAFTFVQYKMMDKQDGDKIHYYYPNGISHDEELKRMMDMMDRLNEEPYSASLSDYRFSSCPFFFKVCRKIQMKQNDGSLTAGAYIPVDHWNVLLNDTSTLGPRGGRRIGFANLHRRFVNSQVFVELVQRGLIGTQSINSQKIGLFLHAAIAEGRSVMYAIDESLRRFGSEDDQTPDRTWHNDFMKPDEDDF